MNLGNFEEPILFFGGVYSNLQALEALKKVAYKEGITPHRIICTGDVVAYCGQPSETVDAVREWGIHVLMGNCEESLGQDMDDCGCGFGEGSQCDLLSQQWYSFSRAQLNKEQKLWMSRLPRQLLLDYRGLSIEVTHGGISQINRFLFATSLDSAFEEEFALSQAKLIVAGHSGIPFTKRANGRYWHNTGALGMPANDGTHQTWYSILKTEDEKTQIETHSLNYDYQTASKMMIVHKLNSDYADCLKNGLWPSMDILPVTEQSKRGIALTDSKVAITQAGDKL